MRDRKNLVSSLQRAQRGRQAAGRAHLGRSVAARFNEETIVTRTWPMADRHVVIAEFHD